MDIILQVEKPLINYLCEPYIDVMKPLWEESHEHHTMKSTYFKEYYEKYNFDNFKNNLLRNYETIMFFFVHEQYSKNVECSPIACCFVGFHNSNSAGFLGNMIVSKEYRRKKIGTQLFLEAKERLKAMDKKLIVELSYGNDTAIEFYKSFGYYPKVVGLQER